MTTLTLARGCSARRTLTLLALVAGLPWWSAQPAAAQNAQMGAQPIVHRVQASNERLEMIVNSSRILTMDQKMAKAQVNNPDILGLTPLSANEVQVFAKKAGVTQVNLWDEKDQIHAVDVIVFGDARELAMVLQSEFPTTSLKVRPLANSVIISGNVDDPAQISRIVEIAQDYHPKVINNITVGGVQQVLLKVKVMEVSRTKFRAVGVDWKAVWGESYLESSVSGILNRVAVAAGPVGVSELAPNTGTMSFGVVNGSDAFFAFLELLRRERVATILAEPNLATYSGRPASFNSGGEFPILIPQSLGTVSVQYKKYGVEVEFVPIVLGNGAIRLEVKPRVSEIDEGRSVVVQGINVPALRVREANTGVEMQAGQSLALAGLVFHRKQAEQRAVPWLGEMPYIGAMFRRTRDDIEEVELLILVTPQFVEGMACEDVPPGGPGLNSASPNDWQLYMRGHLEVPRCEEDDRCAPSRSPGTAYEGWMPSGPEGGESYEGDGEPVPDGEAVVPLPPSEAKARRVPQAVEARRVQQSAARPAIQADQQQATLGRPAGSPVRMFSKSSAKTVSYDRNKSAKPANRNQQQAKAAPGAKPASPGFIGPVGYDVKD